MNKKASCSVTLSEGSVSNQAQFTPKIRSNKVLHPAKGLKSSLVIAPLLLALTMLSACQQTAAPPATPSNDLVFTPAEIEVAPGTTNRVTVELTTGKSLSAATFALNQIADNVALSFEPAADGKSGDLFVALAPDQAAGSQDVSVMGTDGTHEWLGSLTVTASATAPVVRFANAANGKDTNLGTQASPFKTLGKALSASKSGDTVKLSAGIYGVIPAPGASGDTYPLTVPAGVNITGSLDGSSPASEIFGGTGSFSGEHGEDGLVFAADSIVNNLDIRKFTTGLKVNSGKLSLANLALLDNSFGINMTGGQVILKGSHMHPNGQIGVQISGSNATFAMDGGEITNDEINCSSAYAIAAYSNSQVTVKNGVTFRNTAALFLSGSAKATLETVTVDNAYPSDCNAVPIIRGSEKASLTASHTQLDASGNSGNLGISWDSDGALTIKGSTFGPLNGESASVLGFKDDKKHPAVTISDTTFQETRVGLYVPTTVLHSTFLGSGIRAKGLKLRNSIISGGVSRGLELFDLKSDLGTLAQPGGNTFKASGSNVYVDSQVTSGNLNAVGNTWRPNEQGADSQGHFAHGIVEMSTQSGGNFEAFHKGITITF